MHRGLPAVSSIKALHVRLEGFTASFRYPLVISGTQISTPMPSFSNLLGMISACSGRVVGPGDTRIGFEFRCRSAHMELERKDRWELAERGLRPIAKRKVPRVVRDHGLYLEEVPQGIGWRQVYWQPQLDLYVTNTGLRGAFEHPAATPCFGRSQDIAWIRWVREVELHPVAKGGLGPTLLPYPHRGMAGFVVRLAEWFDNGEAGCPRRLGPLGHYHAMDPTAGGLRFEVEMEDLFHPSDADCGSDAIHLHRWLAE